MTIPKDLAKKRDELTQNYYDKYVCGDKPSFVDGFNAGIQAALSSEHVLALVEALEDFKLGHEHAPDLKHTRAMGDTYGWCDICSTKVSWGPGEAEQALDKWSKRNE